jgi:hypothetical protein
MFFEVDEKNSPPFGKGRSGGISETNFEKEDSCSNKGSDR